MRIGSAFLRGVASLALAVASSAAGEQARVVRPAVTPVAPATLKSDAPPVLAPAAPSALLSDIQQQFDAMERSVEMAYAKLIQEAKSNQSALEDKIKQLDRQIGLLKEQAKRIELVAQKIQQLLPEVLAAASGDRESGRLPAQGRQRSIATILASELAKVGVALSPDELSWVAAAIGSGGSAAAGRVDAAARDKISRINATIHALNRNIQALRDQIKALDQEIAKLQKEKEKTLAALRNQKAKTLERAAKESDRASVEATMRAYFAALSAQIENLALRTPTPATSAR